MPSAPPTINPLPTAPDPNDRATFNTRAYAWASALVTLISDMTAAISNVFSNATDAATSASSAAASATNAQASASAAAASVGAAVWVSMTSYSPPTAVISPLDLQAYRCAIAVTSSVDPSQDPTNWFPVIPSYAGSDVYLQVNFGGF